jgi:DNA-binding NarL/FixJ family response regulator
MTRYAPQSQTFAQLEQKRALIRDLLARGLTVTQIAAQLRCSPGLVRRVRSEVQVGTRCSAREFL